MKKEHKTCKHCNGDGINRDYISLYTYRRKINESKGLYVKCKYCNGVGVIDWIQNATKPTYQVNIESLEAFAHLNYIFENVDYTDEFGDKILLLDSFDEVIEEYFKMYNLYIEDEVIIESIPGYCPDVLGHHFTIFDEYKYEQEKGKQ